jgi:hypothetical protein
MKTGAISSQSRFSLQPTELASWTPTPLLGTVYCLEALNQKGPRIPGIAKEDPINRKWNLMKAAISNIDNSQPTTSTELPRILGIKHLLHRKTKLISQKEKILICENHLPPK